MSAKPTHPVPLDLAVSEAVARLLVDLARENDWRIGTVKSLLSKFGQDPTFVYTEAGQYDHAEFEADYSTIKKLIETEKPINDFHMWGFFLYFTEQDDIRPRLERYILDSRLKPKIDLVKSFNKFFGFFAEVDADRCKSLGGTYELFRPSHIRPKHEIMVSVFQIGIGDDLLRCTLENFFTDKIGRERNEKFFGEVIPYGARTMAILRAEGRTQTANIVLHFDGVDDQYNDPLGGGDMHGIMLSAIGNAPGSAWPFYAVKVPSHPEITPRVVPSSDFESLPEDIQDSLNRGAVHWEPKNYPNPYVG
ncbi:hypothetical protein C1T17_07940 [Sphingobium sp. SCG-1]|uniref:hypothetical protein n=1 Tax=Sphingobium sp. SCG-1 TaxID=2072936 RepID=UPI000CD69D6B|nr:hypothetical protein [Sphingobium sp. SCG-1]AUW58048.1 hypothetical protein C1T17_07940 [Sphingobium sp. SCG-1]